MRYPEDKIKEAILHPDLDVRDTAIRYFYSSTRPDHTLMPLAIQTIERYGRTRAFSFETVAPRVTAGELLEA